MGGWGGGGRCWTGGQTTCVCGCGCDREVGVSCILIDAQRLFHFCPNQCLWITLFVVDRYQGVYVSAITGLFNLAGLNFYWLFNVAGGALRDHFSLTSRELRQQIFIMYAIVAGAAVVLVLLLYPDRVYHDGDTCVLPVQGMLKKCDGKQRCSHDTTQSSSGGNRDTSKSVLAAAKVLLPSSVAGESTDPENAASSEGEEHGNAHTAGVLDASDDGSDLVESPRSPSTTNGKFPDNPTFDAEGKHQFSSMALIKHSLKRYGLAVRLQTCALTTKFCTADGCTAPLNLPFLLACLLAFGFVCVFDPPAAVHLLVCVNSRRAKFWWLLIWWCVCNLEVAFLGGSFPVILEALNGTAADVSWQTSILSNLPLLIFNPIIGIFLEKHGFSFVFLLGNLVACACLILLIWPVYAVQEINLVVFSMQKAFVFTVTFAFLLMEFPIEIYGSSCLWRPKCVVTLEGGDSGLYAAMPFLILTESAVNFCVQVLLLRQSLLSLSVWVSSSRPFWI